MFITVITKVHILNQPNLIQTRVSYLCKILSNRYILLRLCLGLPCGLFHFATLCLGATCATSYLCNLTCSWGMENVKPFNILQVTVQQTIIIFLFFLVILFTREFLLKLLSSNSNHARVLNGSCVEAGGTVFWGRSQQNTEMGSCWAVLWNLQILGGQAVWQLTISCVPPCIMSCCE
jgi:hypothetical protein